MRRVLLGGLIALLTACSSEPSLDNGTLATPDGHFSAQVSDSNVTGQPLLEPDLIRVSKAAMSAATGANLDTMKARATSDNMVRISYVRDDGKAFAYDLLVEGNTVKTRMIDEAGPGTGPGAWSGKGSTAEYSLTPSAVTINTTFFDGSSDTEVFKI